MIVYRPSEIYNLYKIFLNNNWTRLNKLFFNTKKEPASVRVAFEKIDTITDRYSYALKKEFDSTCLNKVTFNNMVNLIYVVPYEDLPTYINYKGYEIIANWRLKLGK